VNGVAYFGNDAGVLWAINTSDGAPIWQYRLPSGMAIRSSPAVDGSLVIFGADDGSLYEVNTLGGGLFGSLNIGGKLGSTAASKGVAYVGSDNGSVVAVLESHDGSPALIWSASVGAAIHSPVAFDSSAANNPVVVGDDSGKVTAFNGTTGNVLWTFKTGAAVTAAPSILSGIVYVGSHDGKIRALNDQTGKGVWTFNAGSPITAGGAVGPLLGAKIDTVTYGTAGGNLITLDAQGNRLKFSRDKRATS